MTTPHVTLHFPEGGTARVEGCIPDKTHDGFHSFEELYDHRCHLFIALAAALGRGSMWISQHHHDPASDPMYPGFFVAGLALPGLAESMEITYHMRLTPYWAMAMRAGAQVLDRAPKWDGIKNATLPRLSAYVADSETLAAHARHDLLASMARVATTAALQGALGEAKQHPPQQPPEASVVDPPVDSALPSKPALLFAHPLVIACPARIEVAPEYAPGRSISRILCYIEELGVRIVLNISARALDLLHDAHLLRGIYIRQVHHLAAGVGDAFTSLWRETRELVPLLASITQHGPSAARATSFATCVARQWEEESRRVGAPLVPYGPAAASRLLAAALVSHIPADRAQYAVAACSVLLAQVMRQQLDVPLCLEAMGAKGVSGEQFYLRLHALLRGEDYAPPST